MSPEHCLKLERWQGPPHINVKLNSMEMCLRFVYSTMKTREFVYLGIKVK